MLWKCHFTLAVQSLHEGDNIFMVQLWPMRVDIMDSRDVPAEV